MPFTAVCNFAYFSQRMNKLNKFKNTVTPLHIRVYIYIEFERDNYRLRIRREVFFSIRRESHVLTIVVTSHVLYI